jgi:spermidine dehydrogenase
MLLKSRKNQSEVHVKNPEDGKETTGKARNAGSQTGDRTLGMNQRICRRDFLNSTLLASGSVLLKSLTPLELLAAQGQPPPSWGGYTGEGDYAGANGNTEDVMLAAHAVRDGVFDSSPGAIVDTGEVYDMVVVGGGISGLASALFFKDQAQPKQTCLVLENHPIFGGQARRNEFLVDGHRLIAPQGSNWFWMPSAVQAFYLRVGVNPSEFKYQEWGGPPPAIPLSRTGYDFARNLPSPPNFGFYFGEKFGQKPGKWIVDPWHNLDKLPLSAEMRSDFAKYLEATIQHHKAPTHDSQAELRRLDTVTAEDVLMQRHGISREFIRLYVAPHMAAAIGAGPDAVTGVRYKIYGSGNELTRHSFPGGNTGFTRHIVKTIMPEAIPGPATLEAVCKNRVNFGVLDRPGNQVRIRLKSTAVRVEHEGDPAKASLVSILYTREGKVYRVRARRVVMAGGGWITKHVVRDLPATHREAYDQYNYSASVVANVALRNWRFLHKLGLSGGRWFDGFGFWTEVRKIATFGADSPTIGPDSPTVLSLIVPLYYPGLPAAEQCSRGRAELLATSFRDFERKSREQLTEMFAASGFDARRDIAGIILNRWGHHFVVPQPGIEYGSNGRPAPADVLCKAPFGRIAFAGTDLAADSGHDHAIRQGRRAVKQLMAIA